MKEDTSVSSGAVTEAARQHLLNVRRGLLRLHKVLLDAERADYERAYGQVTSGELLQLVINHEQFVWLHAMSELIVRVDELLDPDESATTEDAEALLSQFRLLLKPSETGGEFGRKYFAALQREPDAVLKHREITVLLEADV